MKTLSKRVLSLLLSALLPLCLSPLAAASIWGLTDEARAGAIPLALDTPAQVHIPCPIPGDAPESKWYKFTPEEDGDYWFACHSQTLGVKPYAWVSDETGREGDYIPANHVLSVPDGFWYNAHKHSLEKGKPYYIETTNAYWFSGGDYTLTVTRAAPDTQRKLVAPKKLTLRFHERIYLEQLLNGSVLDNDFDVDNILLDYKTIYGNGATDFHYDYLYAARCGCSHIRLTSGGQTADVQVTVRYTPAQWFCAAFLGGRYWLRYTPLGDFSLTGSIMRIFAHDDIMGVAGKAAGAVMSGVDLPLTLKAALEQLLAAFGVEANPPYDYGGLLYWPEDFYPF